MITKLGFDMTLMDNGC